jgi:hypothetical protein
MIIIASKPGQLGNRLFVFAHCISWSIENNIKILNPSFDEYAPYFTSTKDNLICSFPPRKSYLSNKFLKKFFFVFYYYLTRIVIRLKIKSNFIYGLHIDWHERIDLGDNDFINLAKRTKYLFMQGWKIRDSKAVEKHSDFIKEFFTPIPEHKNKVSELISLITKQCQILIGIHIRQGDYKKFEKGKFYFSTTEYLTIIEYVVSLFPNKTVAFLICSNEKQDTRLFKNLKTFFGTNQFIEDVYSLAECNYIIGPPSTYTMWASFYGKKPLYMMHDLNTKFTLNDFKIASE